MPSQGLAASRRSRPLGVVGTHGPVGNHGRYRHRARDTPTAPSFPDGVSFLRCFAGRGARAARPTIRDRVVVRPSPGCCRRCRPFGGLLALEPIARLPCRVSNRCHFDAVRELTKEDDVWKSLSDGPPEATISMPVSFRAQAFESLRPDLLPRHRLGGAGVFLKDHPFSPVSLFATIRPLTMARSACPRGRADDETVRCRRLSPLRVLFHQLAPKEIT